MTCGKKYTHCPKLMCNKLYQAAWRYAPKTFSYVQKKKNDRAVTCPPTGAKVKKPELFTPPPPWGTGQKYSEYSDDDASCNILMI